MQEWEGWGQGTREVEMVRQGRQRGRENSRKRGRAESRKKRVVRTAQGVGVEGT